MKFSFRVGLIFIGLVMLQVLFITTYLVYVHSHENQNRQIAEPAPAPLPESPINQPLLEQARQAHAKQDWATVSLYVSRYMAQAINGTLGFDFEAYSECLRQIELRPVSYLSGEYSARFLDWFASASMEYWLPESIIDAENQSFLIETAQKNDRCAWVVGRPFLEGYTIMTAPEFPLAAIPMVAGAEILVGRIESDDFLVEKKTEFPSDGLPVQHIWTPEYHDLDGDGVDEIWIRFNRESGDGFMQCLTIYRDCPSELYLVTNFIGVAEGIARRLPNGHIEVGYGCASDEQETGHLSYDQHFLETFEYRDGAFIKLSERRIPHLLHSDAWIGFYEFGHQNDGDNTMETDGS